ncbi:protein kinase domain-containing protein [Azospirillum lipoferum]|nr:DUF805 domain-containing protein [Azospirillum lipoferum]
MSGDEQRTPGYQGIFSLSGADGSGRPIEIILEESLLQSNGGSVTLGRDNSLSSIVIDDDTVSRQHARFVVSGNELTVEDLNAVNGVYIQHHGFLEPFVPIVVPHGTVLEFGETKLTVSYEEGTRSSNSGASRDALPIGTWLRDYRIEDVLGQGGFGITYRCRDTRLNTLVAIKEFMPQDLAVRINGSDVVPSMPSKQELFDRYRDHFMREARGLAGFNHPNIVRVLSNFEANGTTYTVMQFEDGETLERHLIRQGGRLTESGIRTIFLSILDGLSAMHQVGLLHRDISTNNIIVRRNGDAVLIDFGSLRQAMDVPIGNNNFARSAQTYLDGYSPPEIYTIRGRRIRSTDIYSLAAVIYRVAVGVPPPPAPDRTNAIANNDPDILVPLQQQRINGYSVEFLSAIDWALSLKSKDRPQSIDEWRVRLGSKYLNKSVKNIEEKSGSRLNIFSAVFNFQGRLPRRYVWIYTLFYIVAFLLSNIMADINHISENDKEIIFLVQFFVLIWTSVAIFSKRFHDIDRSGWWALLSAIPVFGLPLLLMACGFQRGTPGPNRFGAQQP